MLPISEFHSVIKLTEFSKKVLGLISYYAHHCFHQERKGRFDGFNIDFADL